MRKQDTIQVAFRQIEISSKPRRRFQRPNVDCGGGVGLWGAIRDVCCQPIVRVVRFGIGKRDSARASDRIWVVVETHPFDGGAFVGTVCKRKRPSVIWVVAPVAKLVGVLRVTRHHSGGGRSRSRSKHTERVCLKGWWMTCRHSPRPPHQKTKKKKEEEEEEIKTGMREVERPVKRG